MAMAGIKFDDENWSYATNCFPVKNFRQVSEEGGGAWLVEHRVEQRKRFKALLCSKPRTFDDIRKERNKADREGTIFAPHPRVVFDEEDGKEDDYRCLDGFFLMKHCSVSDPCDLCSVNISGQQLNDVKEDDFLLFDNVAYMNAAENLLSVEQFKNFSILRDLELPLNGIRAIHIEPHTFPHLEILDLSYNNLSPADLLSLGLLPRLKALHITGNGLRSLPGELAYPLVSGDRLDKIERYAKLEVLMADDNLLARLDTFAALAGLPNLKHLNLSKNEISMIPQLMLVQGEHKPIDPQRSDQRSRRRSAHRSARREKTEKKSVEDDDPLMSLRVETKSLSKEHLETVAPPADKPVSPLAVPDTSRGDTAGDITLRELNLDDLGKKVAEQMAKQTKYKRDNSSAAPFPQLRYIDLSYNKIAEERQLLALSAWPLLSEVIIHDNPIVTEHSTPPPLLKKLLSDKMGINLRRMKPGPLQKPKINISQKSSRKVVINIAKYPRCDVDQLLAIELPRRRGRLVGQLAPSPLLPPIGRAYAANDDDDDDDDDDEFSLTLSESDDEEDEPERNTEFDGDAIFMTQTAGQADGREGGPTMTEDRSAEAGGPVTEGQDGDGTMTEDGGPGGMMEAEEGGGGTTRVDKIYKGYEVLFADNDDVVLKDRDIPPSNDLLGNVRSLHFLLSHPLVFRDAQRDMLGVHKHPPPPKVPHLMATGIGSRKQEQLDDALRNLRDRTAVQEAPLGAVLADPRRYRATFPNAARLLGNVEKKYRAANYPIG